MNFSENHNKQEPNPGECREPVGGATQSCEASTRHPAGLRNVAHTQTHTHSRASYLFSVGCPICCTATSHQVNSLQFKGLLLRQTNTT